MMDPSISEGTGPAHPDHKKRPASLASLEEINRALDGLQPLASKIDELKTGILDKEADILNVILQRISPLIPLLSKDYEACYRHELILLTKTERVKLEDSVDFYSNYMLILYENGQLIDQHCYGENTISTRIGWEIINETYLTSTAAIINFGLDAIVEGLMKIIKDARELFVLKSELENRFIALTGLLEALQ